MKKILLITLTVLMSITTYAQKDDENNIAFAVIENVPVYPGCENENGNDALKKCMSEKITEHLIQNFNTSIAKTLGLNGVQQIYVQFRINKNGVTDKIRARAPRKQLEKESIRVIKMLPKMVPGKQKGKDVGVLYSLPIKFKVEGDFKETPKEKRKRLRAEKRAKKKN